ncbi:MAG: hypothetical protein GEU98_05965 [Pseudonocardiaceae bacterium]|nr:hypothetical protein [Pseudonocardiaceae bacterium]
MSNTHRSRSRRPKLSRVLGCCVAALATVALAAPHAVAQDGEPGKRTRDMTLDGFGDLIARHNNGNLLVYPHSGQFDGENTFTEPPATIGEGWNGYDWLGVADVTGDGNADAIGRNPQTSELVAFPHSGDWNDGNPLGQEPVSFGFGWNGLNRLVFQDFTGDGVADVAGRVAGTGQIQLYSNNGEGGLEAPSPYADGFPNSTWIEAADLNGNGTPELLARGPNGVVWAQVDGSSRVVTLERGWNQYNAITMKDLDGGGVESLVARVAGSNDVVAFPYQGTLDGENTFGDPVRLKPNWNHVSVII